jgi:hypothetical protein
VAEVRAGHAGSKRKGVATPENPRPVHEEELTYRHRNGGLAIGTEAHVSEDSYFDKASEVHGRSVVYGAIIEASTLIDCLVGPLFGASPRVSGVFLQGVRVEGRAELQGPWRMICAGAFIHQGEWQRAPRHILIRGENGVSVAVSECTEGWAHIGCRCREIGFWLKCGPRIGRRLGWTEEQIERCRVFFESLKEEQ